MSWCTSVGLEFLPPDFVYGPSLNVEWAAGPSVDLRSSMVTWRFWMILCKVLLAICVLQDTSDFVAASLPLFCSLTARTHARTNLEGVLVVSILFGGFELCAESWVLRRTDAFLPAPTLVACLLHSAGALGMFVLTASGGASGAFVGLWVATSLAPFLICLACLAWWAGADRARTQLLTLLRRHKADGPPPPAMFTTTTKPQ